jgi:hypothetical protein
MQPQTDLEDPKFILRTSLWFWILVCIILLIGFVNLFYAFAEYPVIHVENLTYGSLISIFGLFTAFYISGRRVIVYSDRIESITRFSTSIALVENMTETKWSQDFYMINLKPMGFIKIPWYLKKSLKLKKHIDQIIEDKEKLIQQPNPSSD